MLHYKTVSHIYIYASVYDDVKILHFIVYLTMLSIALIIWGFNGGMINE
jgi:hypothetical protein